MPLRKAYSVMAKASELDPEAYDIARKQIDLVGQRDESSRHCEQRDETHAEYWCARRRGQCRRTRRRGGTEEDVRRDGAQADRDIDSGRDHDRRVHAEMRKNQYGAHKACGPAPSVLTKYSVPTAPPI